MSNSRAGLGVHPSGGLCGDDPVSDTSITAVDMDLVLCVQFSGSECWCCVRLFCPLPASGR